MLRKLLIAMVLIAFPIESQAAPIRLSDTQPLIDFPDCDCEALPPVLPFALFDFTGQGQINCLEEISLQLTLTAADTMPGNYDFGNLMLELDNVPTGIRLDGFGADTLSQTFTITADQLAQFDPEAAQQILSELRADNQLFASIRDLTPGDNSALLSSKFDTTLHLQGKTESCDPVPEPTTWLLWLSASLIGWLRYRRANSAHVSSANQS